MKVNKVVKILFTWLMFIGNYTEASTTDDLKLVGCSAVTDRQISGGCFASIADLWGPGKWSGLVDSNDPFIVGLIPGTNQKTVKPKLWSPKFIGYHNKNNKEVSVKFMISQEEYDFYATTFNGTTTRVPMALEIDVVDEAGKLGEKGEIDYRVESDLPAIAGIFIDIATFDENKQLSVIIPRPDVLVPGVMYEIRFYPNNYTPGKAQIYLNVQLSMNYGWLAHMHNHVIFDEMQMIATNSNFNPLGYVNSSSYGSAIDHFYYDGWAYYIIAESDKFRSVNTDDNDGNDAGDNDGNDFACSDKATDPEHRDSRYYLCGFKKDEKEKFFKFDHAFSSDLWAGVSSSTVYYLSNGKRYPIFDEEMYRAMGNINTDGSTNWSKVSTITGYLAEYVSSEFPIGKTLNLNGLVAKFPSKGEFATYRLMFGQWYRTREIKSDAILLSDEILKTYPISLYIYEDKFLTQQSIFLSQSSVVETTAQLAVATTEDSQIEGSASDLIEVEISNQEIPEEIAQWYQDNQILTSSNATYTSPYNLTAYALSSVSVKANWTCPANASSCLVSLVNRGTNQVIGPFYKTNATSEDVAQTFTFNSDSQLYGNTEYKAVVKAQYLVTVGSITETKFSEIVGGVFVTTLSPATVAGNPMSMILCDEQSNFTCMNEKNSFKYTPGHVYLEVKLENLYADTLYMKPRLYAPNSNVNLTADFGAYGRFDGNINNQWHTFFDFTELVQQTENQTGIWKIELYCGNTISTINLFCGEVNFVIGERSFSLPLPPMGLKSTIIGL